MSKKLEQAIFTLLNEANKAEVLIADNEHFLIISRKTITNLRVAFNLEPEVQ